MSEDGGKVTRVEEVILSGLIRRGRNTNNSGGEVNEQYKKNMEQLEGAIQYEESKAKHFISEFKSGKQLNSEWVSAVYGIFNYKYKYNVFDVKSFEK